MKNRFKSRILSFKERNQFYPSFAGVLVNPFRLCRKELYSNIRQHASNLQGDVLDFGCGTAPYRSLLTACSNYRGLEFDSPENRLHKRADIFYDGTTIPLEDASIDAVISTQTLEHVPNPDHIATEWARILRQGGKLLVTVPFMWPEHEMPYDFQRYTTNGLRQLLEKHGFEVLHQKRLLSDCRAPAQLFQAWLYDILRLGHRKFAIQFVATLLLFAPISLLATALAVVTPKNSNTYMDNLILARRLPK